ncbi:hypothetical protein CRENPOLYSF2_2540003 [Crenothrix polyspora]|uniref:Uncharacterized protein n=1 Tax=Crenothrix polyspora TaxID=360316 RepID=A0A1R4H744_9GAMM|nr:hypothetical protein [Crenothrix polyspora]SJM92095.1 hypothetical protein CRENPOLYSF2_2540003 [Crenothrix polyspora]
MAALAMKTLRYDQDELELLDFIENGKPDSVPNVAYEIEQLKVAVRAKLQLFPFMG